MAFSLGLSFAVRFSFSFRFAFPIEAALAVAAVSFLLRELRSQEGVEALAIPFERPRRTGLWSV